MVPPYILQLLYFSQSPISRWSDRTSRPPIASDKISNIYAMALDMSALSQMQIKEFFRRNAPVTQTQCDDKAQSIAGNSVTPTACQGGTSYTVDAGQVVVQFHAQGSHLDMILMKSVEQAYRGFTPQHENHGSFGNLRVYTMNNIGGISMYLARNFLQENNYKLLRNTIDCYSRFVDTSEPSAASASRFR